MIALVHELVPVLVLELAGNELGLVPPVLAVC